MTDVSEEPRKDPLCKALEACGKVSGYNYHGCRGLACRRAWSDYFTPRIRAWRKRNRAQPIPDHVHGTLNGYANYSCRCGQCRRAQSAADKLYYETQKRRSQT